VTLARTQSVGFRLGGSIAIVVAVLAGVSAMAITQLEAVSARGEALVVEGLRKTALARSAQNAAQAGATRLHSLFLLRERDRRVPVYQEIDRHRANLEASMKQLMESAARDDERRALARIERARGAFDSAFTETVELIELDPDDPRDAMKAMLGKTMPALETMLVAIDDLVRAQTAAADDHTAELTAAQETSKRRILFLGISGALMGFLLSWLIARSIAGPLGQTVQFADMVAGGRFDGTLPSGGPREVQALTEAFNRMRAGIASREERISELAYRDPLTGLPNRSLFSDRLRQAIANSERNGFPMSVLVMDVDRFKSVNKVLGYEFGDRMLKSVAVRLQEALPRKADTVARLGGDEFAVLLVAQDVREATRVADMLLRSLSSPMTLDGQLVDVGVSIGIAGSPEHGRDPGFLLARADAAMDAARRTKTGFAVFDPAMEADTQGTISLMSELRAAVAEEQLVLFYQPKATFASKHCESVEALIRWQHPARGMVPPDQFILFAEHTGYIREITKWVIDRSVAQAVRWRRSGLDIGVAINVSARDLVYENLPSFVDAVLRQHGLEAERITLEVTESAVMDNVKRAYEALKHLAGLGVRLSVDDFGTGYSSLAQLKRMPVHEMKIDSSFVRELATNPNDSVIVRSTINLGHSMGLAVVAEGIEDAKTWELLQGWGCDLGQGYFLSRPLAGPQLESWLRGRPPRALSSA
jgi:diguanylate cyclase (GGDEF)-like protein